MAQATHAAFDTQHDVDLRSMPERPHTVAEAAGPDVRLSIHGDLLSIESEWRAFERSADCTVFQTFEWMSAWYRNIGVRRGVTPVIVAGRDAAGELVFILPFVVEAGAARRLT
jgi:CelD/BcsL family acetyltransferase involved in cellulose biosynthesis